MSRNNDFRRINPSVKSLYAFLKKYDIEKYFLTKDFKIALMEINLDEHWDAFKNLVISESGIVIIDPEYTGYANKAFLYLLNSIYLLAKTGIIGFLDHILKGFINKNKIDNFRKDEFKQRLFDCGFSYEDIKQRDFLGLKDDVLELSEILNQIPSPQVLPDGIDMQKYDEIFNQLALPSAMFQYIFVCENILRKFIILVLKNNGYPSINSIGNQKLSKAIQDKKKKEANQNYLPIRGDHDIYYLDLIELNRVIRHAWKDCFEDKFKNQHWIFARIDSLYSIRNRVVHSSGYLKTDELKSVETYCREIIKQIDQYIK